MTPPSPRRPDWRSVSPLLLLVAWCGAAWLLLLRGLGSFGFVGPDEPRYASIAASMLHRGDWITPTLWGVPWFEKPVLYYWLAALSDGIRGVSTAASRLPNALLTLALCAAMGLFLLRLHSRRAGVLAAFMGLSTLFLFSFGRAATTDMTLTVPFALAMMALYLASGPPRAAASPSASPDTGALRPGWLASAAILLALATLAKGPVAVVLAALAWIGFAATQGSFRLFWRLITPRAISLFLLVTAPWFVLVELKNPAFFSLFFWQQNLERFATNRFEHPQPFWFYLPVLLLALLPWTGWLGLPLRAGWRRLRRLGWRRAWSGGDAPLPFYLGCWCAAPIVFFSLSHSKLPGYILPAIPAAVMLMAVAAAEAWDALPRWPLAVSAVLTALLPGVVALAPWFLLPRNLRRPLVSVLSEPAIAGLVGVTLAVLLLLLLRRRNTALVAATVILTAGAVLALTRAPLSDQLDARLSGRPLARQLIAACNGGLPEACGTTPLYVWHLKRGIRYGAQFSLHAAFTDWPLADGNTGSAGAAAPPPSAHAPAHAILVLDRTALAEFATRFGADYHIRLQPQFALPPAGPLGQAPRPPWLVVDVSRASGGNAQEP